MYLDVLCARAPSTTYLRTCTLHTTTHCHLLPRAYTHAHAAPHTRLHTAHHLHLHAPRHHALLTTRATTAYLPAHTHHSPPAHLHGSTPRTYAHRLHATPTLHPHTCAPHRPPACHTATATQMGFLPHLPHGGVRLLPRMHYRTTASPHTCLPAAYLCRCYLLSRTNSIVLLTCARILARAAFCYIMRSRATYHA